MKDEKKKLLGRILQTEGCRQSLFSSGTSPWQWDSWRYGNHLAFLMNVRCKGKANTLSTAEKRIESLVLNDKLELLNQLTLQHPTSGLLAV